MDNRVPPKLTSLYPLGKIAESIYNAILNGLSATQYRQNLYFGTGYNIPDFIFENPKELPKYPIYEINYTDKGYYYQSFEKNKSIRIFSVYESDLNDEQKKLYTNSIYLNKDKSNSTESITKYLISHSS